MHDDTFESLGIDDDEIRDGVTFELMAEREITPRVELTSRDWRRCEVGVKETGNYVNAFYVYDHPCGVSRCANHGCAATLFSVDSP